MKRIALVLALAVAGCRSSNNTEAPPPENTTSDKDKRINELKTQRAAKEADLKKVDQEIADADRDMQAEMAKPASKEKSERMAQINQTKADKQQAKNSDEMDIKSIDDELAQLGGAPPPPEKREAKHIDPDAAIKEMMEADAASKEKEKEMAARIAEQDSKAIEEANAQKSLRKTQMDADAKAIAGAGVTNGADLTYEERCAAALARVKAELEKFRR